MKPKICDDCGHYDSEHRNVRGHHVSCQSCTCTVVLIPAPAVMTPVPNKPKTPLRSVRVPDETWHAAQAKAAEKGETVSDVVRRALERYAKRA